MPLPELDLSIGTLLPPKEIWDVYIYTSILKQDVLLCVYVQLINTGAKAPRS